MIGKRRRQLSEREKYVLESIRRDRPDRTDRITLRQVGFVAFWLFVSLSAFNTTAELLSGFGLDITLAAFIVSLVCTGVLLFAGKHGPS
jgi:hypothetical protein